MMNLPVWLKRGLSFAAILSVSAISAPTSSAAEDAKPKLGVRQLEFKPIRAKFIAALGPGHARSGSNAQDWLVWHQDPGPRGEWLRNFSSLKGVGGKARAGWQFDPDSWWVDENGLLMEKPTLGIEPGYYLVTGEREVTTILKVDEIGEDGSQRWELARGAQLHEVTHLPCRSALYTPMPGAETGSCTPANAPLSAFKVPPGAEMPAIEGCAKQDYRVLIIIGVPKRTPS